MLLQHEYQPSIVSAAFDEFRPANEGQMADGQARVWVMFVIALVVSISLFGNDARAGATNYTYDDRGRVTSVGYTDGTTIGYVYDSAGNRTQYTVTGAAAPTVGAVSYSVAKNSANNPVPLVLSGTPASGVTISTAPSNGSASVSGTSITYTPTSGYSGSDSFQYTAWNPSGTSTPATVSLTVATGSIWHGFNWGPPNTWF
jgi:YD repeat-containing protein